MPKHKFREHYSYDPDIVSAQATTEYDTSDPDNDRTVQSYKDEADINVMIKRFGIAAVAKPQDMGYYDFTAAPADYQEALNSVIDAERRFAEVPAEIRARVDNNPKKFAEWINHEANREEAIKLKLLKRPPKAPEPQKVEIINPPKPPAQGASA